MFVVSDLRQYAYCPRIIYYRYCWPDVRPTTFKMEAGLVAQEHEAQREARRSLRTYGLDAGERFTQLGLSSERLPLRGRVDLAIRCHDEAIPVEYKDSPGRSGEHIVLQLMAYGMLLEEAWSLPARRGFIYFIPARRAREVLLTTELRQKVGLMLQEMETMVVTERMPEAPARRQKCQVCEFWRFCNDVM